MDAVLISAGSVKGDLPGHPFRGNQWTGEGGGENEGVRRVSVLLDESISSMSPSIVAKKIVEESKRYAYENGFGLEFAAMTGYMTWNEQEKLGVSVGYNPTNPATLSNLQDYFSESNSKVPLQFFQDALDGKHGDKYQSAAKLLRDQSQELFRRKYGESTEFSRVGTRTTGVIGVSESAAMARHASSVISGGNEAPEAVIHVGIRDVLISHRILNTPYPEMEWIVEAHANKSPSRLTIIRKALQVATQAVCLKEILLKDQLRNAVVKAVHVRQYEQTERELADAVSDLIKRQYASAGKLVKEDGKTDFNPRSWDDDLINTCLPVLMKNAGEAAAAQMLLMGVDITPKKTKGDLPGHPFRGNQWSDGAGTFAGRDVFDPSNEPYTHATRSQHVESILKEGLRKSDGIYGSAVYLGVGTETVNTGRQFADVLLHVQMKEGSRAVTVNGFRDYNNLAKDAGVPDDVDDPGPYFVKAGIDAIRVRKSDGDFMVVFNPDSIKSVSTEPIKSPSFIRTKASRATDWLLALQDEGEDLTPLWPSVFSLPGGGTVDLAFATEWPDWMKAEITKQMQECFQQPFWAGINDTTASGIESHVLKGLEEGWSIREIRDSMVGDGLDEYYHNRGINIARTESGNALNGARSAAMDKLQEEVPGLKVKKTWMSVLGTTTRDTHAALDGVPADRDGLWYLGGVRVPWPGHWNLPCSERANCQCTLAQSWGMSDESAEVLIGEYNQRLAGERSQRMLWEKRRDGVHVGPESTPNCHALQQSVMNGKCRCDKCGSKTKLQVHHIDGDGSNDAKSNLRVLCDACHRELPSGPHASTTGWEKGDLPGHPFRGNQHTGGGDSGGSNDTMQRLQIEQDLSEQQAGWAAKMVGRLESIFKGPGRAAAVNEVISAAKFPEYLKGILQEIPGRSEIEAVVAWSVRRGRVWEAA